MEHNYHKHWELTGKSSPLVKEICRCFLLIHIKRSHIDREIFIEINFIRKQCNLKIGKKCMNRHYPKEDTVMASENNEAGR